MLHLTAARRDLETGGDVAEAVEALREAERVGRQAVSDVRRTVGLLGQPGGIEPPAPTVADLPALVEVFRSAGLDVEPRRGRRRGRRTARDRAGPLPDRAGVSGQRGQARPGRRRVGAAGPGLRPRNASTIRNPLLPGWHPEGRRVRTTRHGRAGRAAGRHARPRGPTAAEWVVAMELPRGDTVPRPTPGTSARFPGWPERCAGPPSRPRDRASPTSRPGPGAARRRPGAGAVRAAPDPAAP